MWFSRQKAGSVAQEIVDHLKLVENVKALQTGQRELADALADLGDRIRAVEIEMRALKAETRLEALKETQSLVNAVQGGLNQRIETLAVKVGVIESGMPPPARSAPIADAPARIEGPPARIEGPP